LQELDEDKIIGSLIGVAVGDAFGAPVEFWPRAKVRKTYPNGLRDMRASNLWLAGEYTDDTQMTLLLADSLLEKGYLEPTDIAPRFRKWARTAKDVGIQIRRVTSMNDYDAKPENCALDDFERYPKNAAGNGAVMRCVPIALFHVRNTEMLVGDSRRSARLTHGDPKAETSCVLINAAIAHFLNGGERDEPWRHGMTFLTDTEKTLWERLDGIETLTEESISSNGYTVSSVEAAFWCFLKTESFVSAVELAVCVGDDSDTTGAVTGGLAGAYYGYDAIPARWRGRLLDLERIMKTAEKLAIGKM
jgi:ADP-ribosyl-[dinitrogen reductase] hydrolase